MAGNPDFNLFALNEEHDDLRLPGRQWAIKRMRPSDSGSQGRNREFLEREAATLSLLRHPNLPVVADSFEEGDDLYLVMAYVEGENLAEHVRRHGPFGEREAFQLGLALCELLDYLHAQHPPIVFRDLKPENCMLCPDGTLKLIDFGLARRFVVGKTSDTLLAGSAGYAPPEQWDSLAQTDPRSDLYAWGATMVFLLTGRIPSLRAPLQSLRLCPTALSYRATALLSRSLEHLPHHRQASAAELCGEIKQVLDAPQESPVESEEPTLRLRWLFPALVGALLLFILLGLGALVRRFMPHNAPPLPPVGMASSSPLPFSLGVAPYRSRGSDAEKMARARALYREGHWNQAVAVLDQVTTQFPEDGLAHILTENAYIHLTREASVTVPFITSLTGVDGVDCVSDLQGVALAQATVNGAGGIGGRKVIIDCHDDESSTAVCLDIARNLLRKPTVRVVLGPMNSQRTLALAPLFNEARVSLVAPAASSRKVWEAGPYVFTASESRGPRVRALARHAAHTGRLRVAGVGDGASLLSREMIGIFKAELEARGGTLVDVPPFQEDARDFREQVEAVVAAAPDMVFFADYHGSALGRFATELRQRGVRVPICAQATSMERELVDVGGASVTGVILCDAFHPHMDTTASRAFVTAFRDKFGEVTPTYTAAENYDAFQAVFEGLRATETREALKTFLRASGVTRPPFEGVSGRFALGRCLDARPVWLIEVVDGRFRLVGRSEAPEAPSAGPSRSPSPSP